ncbi:hypothetical protein HH308_06685 [Gordonia sp. TBRC 11910]|uniref:Uncharacterized protein n=1 Tax=Gordonia asplenii TaxID=2725283 RepID=A0A848KS10_9ACTN|nr:hypothetical protein [Gordonia asplenii]NMO00899.1 hypothetical protein [Gordonia asplenii]
MGSAHAHAIRARRFVVSTVLCGVTLASGAGVANAMVVPASSTTPLFGTDCVYRLEVAVPDAQQVTFIESDVDGERPVEAGTPVLPHHGVASVRWTPTLRGDRILVAQQGAARSVPVPVAVRDGGGALCRSTVG